MEFFRNIKDKLVRRLATTFLLRYLDGYKTEIGRFVQAVNNLIAGLLILGEVADKLLGWHTLPALSSVNARWVVIAQFVGGQLLSLGLADSDAKERLGTPVVRRVK